MRYFIRMAELKDEGTSLRNFAVERIDETVNELVQLKNEMGWDSPAGRDFDVIYQGMINKLYDLGEVMEKLGFFMEYSSEHYTEINNMVASDWEELFEEIELMRAGRR